MNNHTEEEKIVVEEINGELGESNSPDVSLNAQRAKEGKTAFEILMETHGDLDINLGKTPEEWEKMEKEFAGYFPDIYKQHKNLFKKKKS